MKKSAPDYSVILSHCKKRYHSCSFDDHSERLIYKEEEKIEYYYLFLVVE